MEILAEQSTAVCAGAADFPTLPWPNRPLMSFVEGSGAGHGHLHPHGSGPDKLFQGPGLVFRPTPTIPRMRKAARPDFPKQPDGHYVAGKISAPRTTVLSLRIDTTCGQYPHPSRQRCRSADVLPAVHTGRREMTLTRCRATTPRSRTANTDRGLIVRAGVQVEDGDHLSPENPISLLDLNGAYTVKEAADLLQVTTATIYELVHRGEIPVTRVGRQFRFGRFSLWSYMNGLSGPEFAEDLMTRVVRQHCRNDGRCAIGLTH